MGIGNVDLTPQVVQAVRDAVDVLQIASEHTRLRKAGRQYEGLCPLHKEKTPSFSVDPTKGLFYCFGCGSGGDAIRLHMLTTGDDFPTAIEALAHRYGIPLQRRAGKRRGQERDLHGALEAAAEFFQQQLKAQEMPRRYLEDRRVSGEIRERFGIGYAPDGWDLLQKALRSSVPSADLEAAGLIARSERSGRLYDRFRNRLIFPIRGPSGRLVGFGGRTLGDDKAKYINTAETEQFHKSRLLYGLYESKTTLREQRVAVLTEGYFDVIAVLAAQAGGAVASMGTSLTAEQARLLARYSDEVVVAYDGDKAGDAAYRRALPQLLAEGLTVRRAQLGAGQDPDSLRLEDGEEAVVQAMAEAPDAVRLELDQLVPGSATVEPRERARIATDVAELLRPIRDDIVRMGYGQLAADRLGVPMQLLWKRGKRNVETSRPEPQSEQRLTRSMEEQVISQLLGAERIPSAERLPSAEIFENPACRALYEAFCGLYRERERPPAADELRCALPAGGEETAQLAGILGAGEEESDAGSRFGVGELLAALEDRWRWRRKQELARGIREAQRLGDQQQVLALSEENRRLSLALNRRGARGGRR